MTKIHYLIYAILIGLNFYLLNANKSYSNQHHVIENRMETVNKSLMTSVFSINDALTKYELKDIAHDEKKNLFRML